MKRRTAILAGTAAVAAAAGGGSAWWRERATVDHGETAAIDLWSLTFESLERRPMRMADWRGRPLLLNFWATWCGPCVTEMPLLDQFSKDRGAAGLRVLALAIDGADSVRRFMSERSLQLPVAIAGAEGIDLSRSLGNKLGALPFSVVFDAGGSPVARNLGAVNAPLLAEWVGLTR